MGAAYPTWLGRQRPNDTLKSTAKYRQGLLGTLEVPAEIAGQKGTEAPSGKLEGNLAVLTTTIPLLDKKGNAGSGSSAYGIKVTLRIPYPPCVGSASGSTRGPVWLPA